MTGLASKWATDDSLVTAALSQDSRSPQKSARVPAGNPLPSKWADLEPTPKPDFKPPKSPRKELPSPPSSAGRKNGRAESERPHKSQSPKPHAAKTHKSHSKPKSHDHGRSGDVNQLSADFQRLGPTDKRKGDRKNRRLPESPESSDDERVPMTSAGRSLAARIGIPTNDADSSDEYATTDEEPQPQKPTKQTQRQEKPRERQSNSSQQSQRQQNQQRQTQRQEPPKPESSEPKSKYMTPKQKRAMAEKEAQAKLAAEQAERDARLKAEVQSMFDKMNDKSTNWADLEDE